MLRSGRIALCTFLLASTLLRTPLFAADKPKAVPVTVPHLQLRIIDPKTHIVLWGFSEATERNAKDWDKSLAALVNDVKAIAAQPPDSTNK